jgi:hypothetical protein
MNILSFVTEDDWLAIMGRIEAAVDRSLARLIPNLQTVDLRKVDRMKRQNYYGVDDGKPRTNTNYGGVPELDAIADVVLNYRPKAKQPKPRKRKKAKRVKRA